MIESRKQTRNRDDSELRQLCTQVYTGVDQPTGVEPMRIYILAGDAHVTAGGWIAVLVYACAYTNMHVHEIGHWLNLESKPETQMIASCGSQSCSLPYKVDVVCCIEPC